MFKLFSLLGATLLLGGCASITTLGNTFEGAADYRIIPLDGKETVEGLNATDGSSSHGYVSLDKYSRFQEHPGLGQVSDDLYFKEGDNIHISLKTGIIGWFSEGAEQRLLNRAADLISTSPLKGEIAILANVTEKARNPGSRAADGSLEGRVVFYSDDVYVDQRLNEFNVPIYGPARYGGGPLTIDLWILELDRAESEQMGAVLQTLSDLASKAPAVTLPGVDILSQIGTSFLKSNKDDVIGHVAITLVPPTAGLKGADPILTVSDILVSRTGNRSHHLDLMSQCKYEPKMGRVFAKPPQAYPQSEQAYRNCLDALKAAGDNNLMVFSIRKSKTDVNMSSTLELAELNNRLIKAASFDEMKAGIEAVTDVAIGESAFRTANEALDKIIEEDSATAAHQFDAEEVLTRMQCALVIEGGGTAEVQNALCGERAASRQISMNDFRSLARKALNKTCLQASDLSRESLLPELTAEALKAARGTLTPKMIKKRGSCAIA
jgi:hypothetical protein